VASVYTFAGNALVPPHQISKLGQTFSVTNADRKNSGQGIRMKMYSAWIGKYPTLPFFHRLLLPRIFFHDESQIAAGLKARPDTQISELLS
jgi:hypothetical protein